MKDDYLVDLTAVATEVLAEALLARSTENSEGVLPTALYNLLAKLGPIPCVDGVPVRRGLRGEIEAMVIRRGTGPEAGKLCTVGGRIRRNETIEACLSRNFEADLGCEIELLVPWQHPAAVHQCAPAEIAQKRPDFSVEHGKHVTSLYYPVKLRGEVRFGATEHGGQEVAAVEWHSCASLPTSTHFGYGQRARVIDCIKAASPFF